MYGLPDDDTLVQHALAVLLKRLKEPGAHLFSPAVVEDYLRLSLAGQEYEGFVVLFLDAKNRLLESKELFRGTLTHTSVHPREVVKEALAYNARGVLLAHNHPSGVAEPSEADLKITQVLVKTLDLFEVRVLDHFIVAGADVYSFAEHGKL
jgi:DNA repair protein RadC